MLSELSIRNVGVIDDVTLDLGSGLVVLTGETGAGKTMVVSAVELLLGSRADGDRVRAGTSGAVVEARIIPAPAAAGEWLDDGEDELTVRREVAAAGPTRSKVRINGRMAPVSALASALSGVVELHGQSDSARLSDSAMQRELLDRYGGAALGAAAARYAEAFTAWRDARAELQSLQTTAQERAREADRLRFELAEIDGIDPQPDDATTLPADLARLEHAETLTGAASSAAAAIGDDGGARDALGAATAALRGVASVDAELDALGVRAEALAAEAQELAIDLGAYAASLEVDPIRLESLRDRAAALQRLTRKYGSGVSGAVDPVGVADYATLARSRLLELDGGDDRAATLAAQTAELEAAVLAAADELRAQRRRAGDALATVVDSHLAQLGMAGARLTVSVEPVAPNASGADDISFGLAANPGEPALPLGKAASGGERSRVALAVRAALADADDTPVLVFDEVDAGIGGETALAVGRMLARLAARRQVLCVTHLAQLAAFADTHLVVTKTSAGGRTTAAVQRVEGADRVTELSRMLSGTPSSERAASHAAELLDIAAKAAAV